MLTLFKCSKNICDDYTRVKNSVRKWGLRVKTLVRQKDLVWQKEKRNPYRDFWLNMNLTKDYKEFIHIQKCIKSYEFLWTDGDLKGNGL